MNNSQKRSWRLICYLLIVTLVLINAGCSGRAPFTGNPPSGESSEGAIITFAAEEYQRRYYESLMETFHEQNPDITVQFVDITKFFPNDGEWDQYTYFRSLAQVADTVLLQGGFNMDMSRYFRDLRHLYESDASFQLDDFWAGILTACEDTYGNIVGLPLTTTINGVFYDEAAFDAAGVPYPKPGWTWDDFQNAIIATADKKGSQIKYGFYDIPDLSASILAPLVSNYLLLHGGEVDADELLNEVEWYIDLAQAGMLYGIKINEYLSSGWWDDRSKLFDDDTLRPAMWVDSLISYVPTSEMTYSDSSNPFSGMAIDQFGFAPYPVSSDGSSTQTNRSWVECGAVSSGSKNPRAAWAWLNFLSRQWIVMDKPQVYEINRAPSRQSVADSNGYWDLLPNHTVPAVRYALEHGSYNFPYLDQFGEIHLALAKTVSENADFKQVLEDTIAARPAIPTPPADNDPIVVATPLGPPPEGVTVIKYYSNTYNLKEFNALQVLIEEYNQRAVDTQLNLVTDFQGEPGVDWIKTVAENTDCFTTNAPYWEFFDTSTVLSLNSMLSLEPASFSNDFSPEMMEKFSQRGNLYGLPASSQVYMMAYNADLLARRGLSIPANDWSFDDFIELASAAASTADADPSYGFSYYVYSDFLSSGKGIQWFDMKSNPPLVFFDSPEVLEHLRWLSNLAQENVIFDPENDSEKMNAIMSAGQLTFWTAMMGEKDMWYEVYEPDQEVKYKIGMVPIPQVSGDPTASWSNDRGHFISARSQAPQVCWDWIKFLSEQPTLYAGVPARRSLAVSPEWEASVGEEDAAAYRAALVNREAVDIDDVDIGMQQVLWPLTEWRSRAIKAALEGEDIQRILIAQQQKAETYLACVLVLDTNQSIDQLKLERDIRNCLVQADPEGGW